MNILPVRNNSQNFRGSIVVNNLKNNKIEKIVTTGSMDKRLQEDFNHIIKDNLFIMQNSESCLENLKTCVKNFSEIVDNNFFKGLKFPSAKDFSVIYSSVNNISRLDVPEYFSIIHSVK